MVNIRKHLVSNNIAKRVIYSGINSKKYIVIHETANTNKGANANAHARLQASGNSRQASWHYQVDDKEIVQSFSDNVQCWHAGNRKYNEQSLGIEICVNEDGDFKKAVDNAAELTRYLMNKYNISASNVIQHQETSGKNCPKYLRSGEKGITWNDFKKLLNVVPRPAKGSTTSAVEMYEVVTNLSAHITAVDAKNNKNKRGTVRPGKYYVYRKYDGMINLTTKRDIPGSWVDPRNNKVTESSKTTTKNFKVGQKVKINSNAKYYSRTKNAPIPNTYKNRSYTIQQVGKEDVLIKELYSWVKKKDTY